MKIEISKIEILSFSVVFLYSCFGKVDCPKFDDGILNWYPYEIGETIELACSDSMIILSINDFQIDHTESYDKGADCGTCDDQIFINTNNEDKNFYLLVFLNKNKIQYEDYYIKGENFSIEKSTTYNNFDFQNKTYKEVKVYTNKNLSKLIVAKGSGIIGFVNKNDSVWSLKQKTIPENTSQRKINKLSCGK